MELSSAVRVEIYRRFLESGRAPTAAELGAAVGCEANAIEEVLVQLAEAHTIVLAPGTRSIWMAHPFSAAPTAYRVGSAGVSYWANCAWDALGIAAMLGRDTECAARCPDCPEWVDLSVRGGTVGEGTVHFVVPPRQFWDNVAFT